MVIYDIYFVGWYAAMHYFTRKAKEGRHLLSDYTFENQILVGLVLIVVSFVAKLVVVDLIAPKQIVHDKRN